MSSDVSFATSATIEGAAWVPLDREDTAYIEAITAIVPSVTKGAFLDVGAGDGYITAAIGQDFKRVVAVEPSEELAIALRKRHPGMAVWAESLERCPFMGHFDLILLCHSLYFLDNWQSALERLSGWLTSDGCLVVLVSESQGSYEEALRLVITGSRSGQRQTSVDGERVVRYLQHLAIGRVTDRVIRLAAITSSRHAATRHITRACRGCERRGWNEPLSDYLETLRHAGMYYIESRHRLVTLRRTQAGAS